MKKVVIIGGGLAGLSAAHHLAEHQPLVLEKEAVVGGLCRSFQQDGFTFDCTGHLIHLKHQYTKDLIAKLLPDSFNSHERLAAIHSKNTRTPYPFQANTYGLPAETIKECLLGFIETLKSGGTAEPANFHHWILQTFGEGIGKHFMLPYNEKFWKQDLRRITSDWVGWSIPKPSLEDIVNGALGITNKGMGYNPRFIYPKTGGIDCLPLAFAGSVADIRLNESVDFIDPQKKYVRLESGREESYDYLVSTMPLPVTYSKMPAAPDGIRHAASALRAISVLNINIGIDRAGVSSDHWIYFPEDEFVFSRIGFPMNFSDAVAPPGHSSIYIEITHLPGRRPDLEEVYARSIEGLKRCGVLRDDDRIVTRNVLDIGYAYVVFDEHRQKHIDTLTGYLESQQIFTAGRYGRWEYHSMEDSILSGKSAADKILQRLDARTA